MKLESQVSSLSGRSEHPFRLNLTRLLFSNPLVIVATQMLDSMQRNPRPTRAEVTDVGTAVLDGADAVMLSGETAAGKYPIESIRAMASVVTEADHIVDARELIITDKRDLSPVEQELDAVAASAVQSAKDMHAKLIILITMTGNVARAVALHRPNVPVLAFCTDAQGKKTWHTRI